MHRVDGTAEAFAALSNWTLAKSVHCCQNCCQERLNRRCAEIENRPKSLILTGGPGSCRISSRNQGLSAKVRQLSAFESEKEFFTRVAPARLVGEGGLRRRRRQGYHPVRERADVGRC